EFGKQSIAGMVKNYFEGSYMSVVSSFVSDEKISVDELQALIKMIEEKKKEV
ncbi:MAG: BlaI/MecI/CopY family transcriptional regulator, partial [Prevotella sp.]|nr:BlaI/MecI/CopY family transcriptional regulator [Prevotella sp.]